MFATLRAGYLRQVLHGLRLSGTSRASWRAAQVKAERPGEREEAAVGQGRDDEA